MRKNLFILLTSTALVAAGTPALAQSGKTQQPAQQATTATAPAQQLSARQFVQRAAISNMFEIESGQLADEKSGNETVKEFASRMIEDHQAAGDDLKTAAGDIKLPTELDQRHARQLDSLENLSGARFDRRFASAQVSAHRQAVSLFENFVQSNDATGGNSDKRAGKKHAASKGAASATHQDLIDFASQTLPTLREHLKMARNLHQKLRTGNRTSERSDDSGASARNAGGRTADAGRTLTIRQGQPEVTVRDPQTQVSIKQAQPQITIRQAAPTITIEQPQPEIVVRMPKPDVNVDDGKPQVSVNMPKPKVDISGNSARPAQVDVVGGDNEQDRVAFSKARQPQVTFERTGEPQVVYQRAQGQPEIRYEQTGDSGGQQAQNERMQSRQAGADGTQAQSSGNGRTADQAEPNGRQARTPDRDDWVKWATRLANDKGESGESGDTGARNGDGSATTGSAPAGEAATTRVTVEQLTGMSIYNERGQNLGDIDQVIADKSGNRNYVVLAHGGFIGLFEDEVALPLARLTLRNDRLVVSGLTEEEVENMQDWDNRIPNHRELDEDQTVSLTTAR